MLLTKYKNLVDEMEISNSNVRKFYQLEQQLKSLIDENNRLTNQLKVAFYHNFRIKKKQNYCKLK